MYRLQELEGKQPCEMYDLGVLVVMNKTIVVNTKYYIRAENPTPA